MKDKNGIEVDVDVNKKGNFWNGEGKIWFVQKEGRHNRRNNVVEILDNQDIIKQNIVEKIYHYNDKRVDWMQMVREYCDEEE